MPIRADAARALASFLLPDFSSKLQVDLAASLIQIAVVQDERAAGDKSNYVAAEQALDNAQGLMTAAARLREGQS